MANGQYTCYSSGCAKKNWIDLKVAGSTVDFKTTCEHCGKSWAVSFVGRTCCSIILLFVSIEEDAKKPITKLQRFKLK